MDATQSAGTSEPQAHTTQSEPRTSKHPWRKRGALKKHCDQVGLLLYKQLLLMWRRWPWTIVRALWPALVVLVWWLALGRSKTTHTAVPLSTHVVGSVGVPRCVPAAGTGCDDPRTVETMRIFAELNTPPLSFDYANPCNNESKSDILGFPRNFDFSLVLTNTSALADYAVSFNDSFASEYSYEPASQRFSIWTERADNDPFLLTDYPEKPYNIELMAGIDRAIITLAARNKYNDTNIVAEIEHHHRDAPKEARRQTSGPNMAMFVTMPLLVWIIVAGDMFAISSNIHFDRSSQIRQGLRMMGLQSGPYWISWLIIQAIWGIIFTLVVNGVGYATGFAFFRASHFGVLLIFFYLSYMAMSTFTLWLCSWVHHQIANTLLVVLSFLIGLMFIWMSSFLGPQFFAQGKAMDVFNAFVYPTQMGRVTLDVVSVAMQRSSNSSYPAYSWADARNSTIPGGMPASHSFGFLVLEIFLGFIFAYYFDVVWPGATGIPRSLLFFFDPKFWRRGKYDESIVELDTYDKDRVSAVAESLDPDIRREHDTTMKRMKAKDKSMMFAILKLSKTFKKGRKTSSQDCRALDTLTACADRGTVFSILGHNGAGKSTAINLLTGLFPPTFGDAYICGHNITNGMEDIQEVIGVCPQQDIVWPDLTGYEHLKIFCMLKGIPSSQREEVINSRAAMVRLQDAIHRKVQTYSGGMKRRLSVAISTIGDPKVIFMDEPTTGLDPASRGKMWNVIGDLKANRLVVLTTHSMSEAEALSDKICILALGRLRAVGSTLHLKQRYGAGYRISAIVDGGQQNSEAVKQSIASIVPAVNVEVDTVGHVVWSMSAISAASVTDLLRYFEASTKSGLIKDWGLTQTSLEEIFLRVVHGGNQAHDKEAVDQTAEVQLTIVMDDPSSQPLGFIKVTRMDTLATARVMIGQLVDDAPKNFVFLANGVPIGHSQENSIYAADMMPGLVLRHHVPTTPSPASSVSPSYAPSAETEELRRKLDESEAEKREAQKRLHDVEAQMAQQAAQHSAQIEALMARLAALEQQQQQQHP